MLPESRARAILEKFAEEAAPDSRYDTATGAGRIRTARRFGFGGTPQERAQIAKMPEGALYDMIRKTQSNLPPAERLRRGTETTAFVPRSDRWDAFDRRALGMQPTGYSDTVARREEMRGPAREAKRSAIVAAQTGTADATWSNTASGLRFEDNPGGRVGPIGAYAPEGRKPKGNMADSSFRSALSTAQSLRGSDGQKLQGKELVDAFQKRMEARSQTAQSSKPEHRSPSGVAIENPFGGAAAATPSQPKTPPAVGHVMPGAPSESSRNSNGKTMRISSSDLDSPTRPGVSVAAPGQSSPPPVAPALSPAPRRLLHAPNVTLPATPVASPPRPSGAGQMAQQPLVPPLTLSGRFGG
jgi:hypothetical protein